MNLFPYDTNHSSIPARGRRVGYWYPVAHSRGPQNSLEQRPRGALPHWRLVFAAGPASAPDKKKAATAAHRASPVLCGGVAVCNVRRTATTSLVWRREQGGGRIANQHVRAIYLTRAHFLRIAPHEAHALMRSPSVFLARGNSHSLFFFGSRSRRMCTEIRRKNVIS